MQLDEEKLEALRSWGERLRQAGGDESAAVGRAILMLVEEIDRLHIELWHARMQARDDEAVAAGETAGAEAEPIGSGLQTRLQQALRRDPRSDPAEPRPEPDPEPAPERVSAASPQAWIAALRRQK